MLTVPTWAQYEVTDYTDDDANEIEVIDDGGNSEAFDFPEALTDANLDSLMNLYMAKT